MNNENIKFTKKFMPIILRRVRDKANISLQFLADKIGISKGFYAKLELGLKTPNIDMLFRIADALGIEAAEIIRLLKEESRKL